MVNIRNPCKLPSKEMCALPASFSMIACNRRSLSRTNQCVGSLFIRKLYHAHLRPAEHSIDAAHELRSFGFVTTFDVLMKCLPFREPCGTAAPGGDSFPAQQLWDRSEPWFSHSRHLCYKNRLPSMSDSRRPGASC